MFRFLLRLFSFTLLSLVFAQAVLAAGPIDENRTANFSFSFEVPKDFNEAPTSVSLKDVVPGKTYKGKLIITNQDDVDAEYEIQVHDGIVDANGKFVFNRVFTEGGGGDGSLGSWVKFDRMKEISINGVGKSVQIPFSVTIPAGSSPGDYVAHITVVLSKFSEGGLSPADIASEGAKVSVAIGKGGAITFNVTGDVYYDLQINTANWDNKLGQGYHVKVDLQNHSNVSVRPMVFVDVKDTEGEIIYSDKFLTENSLFPSAKETKDLYLKELKELPYGKYDVFTEVYYLSDYDFMQIADQIKEGKVAKDGLTMSGSATFAVWILPFQTLYIVIGVAIVLLAIYLLWFYLRKIRKKI